MAISTTGMHERMMEALSEKRKFLSGESSKRRRSDEWRTSRAEKGATKRTGLQQAGESLRQGRGFQQQDRTAATSRQQSLTDMARQREQTLTDTSSKREYESGVRNKEMGIDWRARGGGAAGGAAIGSSGQWGIDHANLKTIQPSEEFVNVPRTDYSPGGSMGKHTGGFTPYPQRDPVTGKLTNPVKKKRTGTDETSY